MLFHVAYVVNIFSAKSQNCFIFSLGEILRQSQSDLAKLMTEYGQDTEGQSQPQGQTERQELVGGQTRRDASTQSIAPNVTPAHQTTPSAVSTQQPTETVDINVPHLQLSGSDINVPMDLSRGPDGRNVQT